MAAGEVQQFAPPRCRHGMGCRALVAWRDEDGIAFGKRRLVKHQTAAVDRKTGDTRCALFEDIAKVGIGRVLDHHPPFRRHQQLRHKIKRVLRAKGDEDLFRPGGDAAPRQAAGADIIDQHRIVAEAEITDHPAKIPHAERLARAVPPGGQREQLVIDLPVDERIGIFPPVQRFRDRPDVAAGTDQLVIPVHLAPGPGLFLVIHLRLEAADGRLAADHMARSFTRLDKTGIDKRLIGENHSVAGDAQLIGQRAAGGELVPRKDGAREDRLDHGLAKLCLKAGVAFGIEIDDQMIQHMTRSGKAARTGTSHVNLAPA